MFWELVTGGGGGADVACGLILGRWELGPASAARVGENDRWSGAVKSIPVLLLGTTCCLEQARDGWKVVPDGDDGVEMAWWRRCESSVGVGGIEGESRETGVQKRFTYHGLSSVVCSAGLAQGRCRLPIAIPNYTHVASAAWQRAS